VPKNATISTTTLSIIIKMSHWTLHLCRVSQFSPAECRLAECRGTFEASLTLPTQECCVFPLSVSSKHSIFVLLLSPSPSYPISPFLLLFSRLFLSVPSVASSLSCQNDWWCRAFVVEAAKYLPRVYFKGERWIR